MKSLSLIKGLSWLILLNLLVKPVWIFLIDRQVQNQLGHEVYGSYFALFNLSLILLFFSDAGLSNLMNRNLAGGISLSISGFFRLKLALSVLYVLILIAAGLLSGISEWKILFYIMTIHLLTSFFIFLRSILTAHQLFGTDAWLSVIDKLVLVLIASGFIYWPSIFGSMDLELFLRLQLISVFVAVCTAAFFVIQKKLWAGGSDQPGFRPVLVAALPFAIVIVLMSVHSRIDAFLLERIHPQGAMQAGIYALGFRLLDAANMVGYLSASFLVPFVARNKNDQPLITGVVRNLRHVLVLGSLFIGGFAFSFAPWIQKLLYHSNVPLYSEVILLTLAVLPAYYLVHIYGSLLTATSRLRPLIMVMLCASILNMVLNLALVPAYGAIGCCMAALCSQYLAAIAVVIIASGKLTMQAEWHSWLFYLLFALLTAGFFYLAKMTIINVWLILAISVIILLILVFTRVSFLKKQFFLR